MAQEVAGAEHVVDAAQDGDDPPEVAGDGTLAGDEHEPHLLQRLAADVDLVVRGHQLVGGQGVAGEERLGHGADGPRDEVGDLLEASIALVHRVLELQTPLGRLTFQRGERLVCCVATHDDGHVSPPSSASHEVHRPFG